MQLESTAEAKTYPVLSGAFLIALAVALVLVSWAVGTENYPYIHRRIIYRFPFATLDRVYLVALGILALHYAAYVAHYLMIGSRQRPSPRPLRPHLGIGTQFENGLPRTAQPGIRPDPGRN